MNNKQKSLILAQCDAHVAAELVQNASVQVESMVAKLSINEYEKLVFANSLYKLFDELLRLSYNEAKQAKFYFKIEEFGGYGLFYGGEETLKVSKTGVPIPKVWAVLEKINSADKASIKPISVFQSTKACSRSRIMVGTVRFANHSCDPNCWYQLSESKGRHFVNLIVIRDILPEEEVTVFYGDSFFGDNNGECLCPLTELHGGTNQNVNEMITQELILKPKIDPVENNLLSGFLQKRNRLFVASAGRKRIKRDVEMRQYSSDDSDIDISSSNDRPCLREESNNDDKVNEQSSRNFDQAHIFQETALNFCSSPQNSNVAPLTLSEVSVIPPPDENDSELDNNGADLPMSEESVTLSNFCICVNAIVAKHGTSNAEAADCLNLIKISSGRNDLPSFRTLKKEYHLSQKDLANFISECGDGERYQLHFVEELHSVVQKNISSIVSYDFTRDTRSDFKIPACLDEISKILKIFLILNSDGVRIMKSANKSIWPVWLAVANLPPIKRLSFENIVLASLWPGNNKPNWDEIFKVRRFSSYNFLFQNFLFISRKTVTEAITGLP